MRCIFVTGGVVSSLGKGLAAASLAAVLQARGYTVRLRKLDPYLNVDAGTMSPTQHGEVFVTEDGAETDLDLGHYERFTGVAARRSDNVTAGRAYLSVLERERRGDYLGATVQVVPHITDEIKHRILDDTGDPDFLICELGGTVGDIEGLAFIEAIRQLAHEIGPENALFLHVTLMPYIPTAGELKTKPTQHSVKELLGFGVQPDIILCRADRPIPETERRKIALFCNVRPERVITAQDVDTIYQVPANYHAEGLDAQVLAHFGLDAASEPDMSAWTEAVRRVRAPAKRTTIAVVGKYMAVKDSYKSLTEALAHGGIANDVGVDLRWVDSAEIEAAGAAGPLAGADGILVPGGFGARGTDGKIAAIRHARERRIPFLGICFGMQLAVIEAARNLAGLAGAGSTELGTPEHPVVGLMEEWEREGGTERRAADGAMGGTMRLGSYPAHLQPGSLARAVYGAWDIVERHRHRYEVNVAYRDALERVGVLFSGMSPDGRLPEVIELPDHPWFIGVQFHPELRSKPFDPHPLFSAFVAAAAAPR